MFYFRVVGQFVCLPQTSAKGRTSLKGLQCHKAIHVKGLFKSLGSPTCSGFSGILYKNSV